MTEPSSIEAEPHTGDRSTAISLLAGLAWIGGALCYGYLAFLQLQYAPLLPGQADQLRGLAVANGITAAITLFIGARLVMGASRNALAWSAVWGGLSVAYGAWQISQGVTHEVFVLGTLLAGAAGVLSLVAAYASPRSADERPIFSPIARFVLFLIGGLIAVGSIGLFVNR